MADTEEIPVEEEVIQEEPKATKKSRKVSKEQLEVIQKKGLEQLRKQNEVNKYEKERKKKELNEKYDMIQKEKKAEQDAKEKEQQPTPEPPKPKAKARRPIKKIIEVYEDDEDDEEEEEEEEEEVIVKKVIKKKPAPSPAPPARRAPAPRREKSLPELYQLSNQEMLKRRLYHDIQRKVMAELFDC